MYLQIISLTAMPEWSAPSAIPMGEGNVTAVVLFSLHLIPDTDSPISWLEFIGNPNSIIIGGPEDRSEKA